MPLRARIAERLHQSGPTVSQTVARMERDGLLTVQGDRHLELTDEGQLLATRVMRKHRLAERLLTDVIGLDWELVHAEACRWEHVMSETVERRLLELLDHPTESPYGNPIPGLDELGRRRRRGLHGRRRAAVGRRGARGPARPRRRISEEMQKDEELMGLLRRVGALPGKTVTIAAHRGGHPRRAPAARPPSSSSRRPSTSSSAARRLSRRALESRTDGRQPLRSASAVRNSLHPTSSLYDASVVAAGRAAVHDHDRRPALGRPLDEPQPAHHRQRRPGDEQRPGACRAPRPRRSSARPGRPARSRRRRPRRA